MFLIHQEEFLCCKESFKNKNLFKQFNTQQLNISLNCLRRPERIMKSDFRGALNAPRCLTADQSNMAAVSWSSRTSCGFYRLCRPSGGALIRAGGSGGLGERRSGASPGYFPGVSRYVCGGLTQQQQAGCLRAVCGLSSPVPRYDSQVGDVAPHLTWLTFDPLRCQFTC